MALSLQLAGGRAHLEFMQIDGPVVLGISRIEGPGGGSLILYTLCGGAQAERGAHDDGINVSVGP